MVRSHRDRIWSTTVVRHSSSSVTTAGRPQDRLMLLMFCFCFLFLRCIFPPSRVGASGVFWSAEREDRSASFSCLFGFVSFSFRFVLFFLLSFFFPDFFSLDLNQECWFISSLPMVAGGDACGSG